MNIQPFSLERFFAAHEFSAKYLLGSSDPESMTLGELLSLEPNAEKNLLSLWLGYTESTGNPSLRQAISSLYQTISPKECLVFSGAQEPIFTFMQCLLQPGDHIIVQTPCYQSHTEIARSIGADVSEWKCRFEAGWSPDLNELSQLIRHNTKLLLVNSPHNPTGYQFEINAWDHLIAFAKEHRLWLFSDEVYRGLEQNLSLRLPAACDLYERAVSLHCTSKAFGLAGLRIGWLATHAHDLLQKMAAFKDYLTICNSAPSEFLATIAIRHADTLFARSISRLRQNLALLESFVSQHAALFRWNKPIAGSTVLLRYLPGDASSFCAELLSQTGVMLVPGKHFSDDGFIRVGYGRQNFPEALSLVSNFLSRAGQK